MALISDDYRESTSFRGPYWDLDDTHYTGVGITEFGGHEGNRFSHDDVYGQLPADPFGTNVSDELMRMPNSRSLRSLYLDNNLNGKRVTEFGGHGHGHFSVDDVVDRMPTDSFAMGVSDKVKGMQDLFAHLHGYYRLGSLDWDWFDDQISLDPNGMVVSDKVKGFGDFRSADFDVRERDASHDDVHAGNGFVSDNSKTTLHLCCACLNSREEYNPLDILLAVGCPVMTDLFAPSNCNDFNNSQSLQSFNCDLEDTWCNKRDNIEFAEHDNDETEVNEVLDRLPEDPFGMNVPDEMEKMEDHRSLRNLCRCLEDTHYNQTDNIELGGYDSDEDSIDDVLDGLPEDPFGMNGLQITNSLGS